MDTSPPLYDLEEMKQTYIKYRTLRYMMENPQTSASKARKYARVAWRKKMRAWQSRGLIITQLAPGVFTNADPKFLPRWKVINNPNGTTSYVAAIQSTKDAA